MSLGTESESDVLLELPLYGASRLGVAYYQGGVFDYHYELSDHLGNVRAVIRKGISGNKEVLEYHDYYPFGWAIPGRSHEGANNYRYGFQGQYAEQDEETGWNAFELRSYDGRVGRWMTIDPMEEFWSPYLAFGNRPHMTTDPTGGSTESPEWIDNGDGTWTAEYGDSAWSLSMDAGIDPGLANRIVQSQLGLNYIGSDGGLKSNVEMGDVVELVDPYNFNWLGAMPQKTILTSPYDDYYLPSSGPGYYASHFGFTASAGVFSGGLFGIGWASDSKGSGFYVTLGSLHGVDFQLEENLDSIHQICLLILVGLV